MKLDKQFAAQQEQKEQVEITEVDIRFISWLRRFGWGRVEIQVKNGLPVMAKVIEQHFKFD